MVFRRMGQRLTDYPLKLSFEIVESAANTFTQVEIDTPVGQILSGNKVQAMECLAVIYDLQSPSQEASQGNFSTAQLTNASQVAIIDSDDPDMLWQQVKEAALDAAGAKSINVEKGIERDEVGEIGGAGVLFYAGTMFGAIQGSGNASARFCDGYVLYHLAEIEARDVVQALLTA